MSFRVLQVFGNEGISLLSCCKYYSALCPSRCFTYHILQGATVTHSPKIKPSPRYLTLFEWPRVLCFDELFRQMTVAVLLPYWEKGHLWTKQWGKSGEQREGFDFVSQKKSSNMVCSSYQEFWHDLSSFLTSTLSVRISFPLLITWFVIFSSAWSRGWMIFALCSAELHLVCLPACPGRDKLLSHPQLQSQWPPESAPTRITVEHKPGWAPEKCFHSDQI